MDSGCFMIQNTIKKNKACIFCLNMECLFSVWEEV